MEGKGRTESSRRRHGAAGADIASTRPTAPTRRTIALAGLVAPGLVALEYARSIALYPDVSFRATGVAAHALLDFAWVLPLVLLALCAAPALAARAGVRRSDWSGLLGTAGAVALWFLVTSLPVLLVRDVGHEAIGTRYGVVLAETRTSSSSLDPTLEETAALCSFGSLRTPGAALRPGETSGAGSIEALQSAAEDALLQQAALWPLLALGFLALFRRELPPSPLAALSRSRRRQLARDVRWSVWVLSGLTLFSLMSFSDFGATPVYAQTVPFNACTDGGPQRTYDVSAIEVTMTLNRFGDHDPDAFMYVLDSNIQDVRDQEALSLPDRVSHGLRKDAIQPLVIRANLGECLIVNFTNQLSGDPAAMHFLGLPHKVEDAGGEVGLNPDTFADPGQSITYQIPIPSDPMAERAYNFYDHGASRQRVAHGLFGAVVVEPAGATYLDPETGGALSGSNWEAIIVDPAGVNFREFVIIYHEIGDESFTNIRDGSGRKLPQLDQQSNIYRVAARALNYRSEPFFNRMDLHQDKSQGYGSYMFGDPATPTPRSYLGEPTKTRLMHGGSELFHVHHLHGGGDRWRRNPKADPNNDISSGLNKEPTPNVFSTHLDSQSIGPSTSYNLEHECGAGGCQGAAGDFLYHCHIGQHYIAGMWGFWRVFDTAQSDLAQIPSGPAPESGVSAYDLLFSNSARLYDGLRIVLTVNDPLTEISIDDWVESQLPPQGVRFHDDDATVWDWMKDFENSDPNLPIWKGEPEDTAVWANFESQNPGVRPEILFNPDNGRYAWPLLRPHLAKRPPFAGNGHSGAPWLGENGDADRVDGLCPDSSLLMSPHPDRKTRFYPISSIAVPVQVTDSGTDNDGKIFVLNEDKAAVIAGTKPRQPLAIRSNVQDCVEVLFTNEITDGSADKVNMHTHFVQFDPQASDGVITGLSYEQSVRPHLEENRTLSAGVSAGATTVDVSNTTDLRVGIFVGVGLGEGVCTPGGGEPVPCTEIRKITDITGSTLTLDAALDFAHFAGESVGVEFVRYAWYSDVDTGTVFWHDHVDFFNWDHGLFGAHIIEPAGSTYHDPDTGLEVRSGTIVDVHAPAGSSIGAGQSGAFREFMVFLQNGSPVTGGTNSGGVINLRAEPLSSRAGNDAHVFSSVTHDDPFTPVPRAYVGDPFVIRGLGVVERVGGLRLTGHRFRIERFAGTASFTDGTHIGISERFDLVLDGGAGGPGGAPGDYLYYSTMGRDWNAGAWGLLRVHDTLQPDLQVLPDRAAPPTGAGFPELTFTGGAPPEVTGPGDPCPGGAPVRAYNVRISPTTIVYQDAPTIINDNAAFAYTLDSGANPAEVREPLVLRANAGECLEVTLTNGGSARASMAVGELLSERGSAGSAVGFNRDSTVAAGQSRLYRFYADEELGTTLMLNLADIDTLPRGAYGAVVVEPADATFVDPATGTPIQAGVIAEIQSASQGTFRELVALFADEETDLGQSVMPYPTAVSGSTGISYSRHDLADRGSATNPSQVFSSTVHGDPRLVLSADPGLPVRLRVGAPWTEQPHVFSVEGHRFPQEPDMVGSEQLSSRLLTAGQCYDAVLVDGAGADIQEAGDYLFLDNRDPFTEAGLWGILRVGAGGPPPPPPVCELGQPGDPCVADADCCSESCKGKPGAKTCR